MAISLMGCFPSPELYTQFVGGKKASLDSVNEYRLEALEAYATLFFGASTVARGRAIKPSPRTYRGDAMAY
jgi:hypothetical protein